MVLAHAFDLGSTNYPDTAFLRANFTDGTSAIFKSFDEQLFLCEDDSCTCKQSVKLVDRQAIADDASYYINSLSICDIECIECNFVTNQWDCRCHGNQVMKRNIQ